MPPPRQILSPTLHGFVCRSCLSKLNGSQRQLPPWLARSVRTVNGPSRSKRDKQAASQQQKPIESSIKYFEETPDGRRTEMPNDEDEETFLDSLASQFGFGEKEKEDLRSTRDNPPVNEIEGLTDINEAMEGKIYDDEDTWAITTQTERLDALITKLKSISDDETTPHEERRTQIRELLFDPVYGPKGINKGIKSGEVMKIGSQDDLTQATHALLPPSPDSEGKSLLSKFPHKASGTGSPRAKLHSEDFPPSYHHHIRDLQLHLSQAAWNLDNNTKRSKRLQVRTNIWGTYLMCRSAFLASPKKVPKKTWFDLWSILANTDATHNIDKMAHLKYLGDDICKVGIRMNTEQRLLYIEALVVSGDMDLATQLWESIEPSFDSTDKLKQYQRLGIHTFCRKGRVDQALQLASRFLKNTEDVTDYRILLPIIQACLVSREEYGARMAWALYVRLRLKMGSQMEMDDYDIITMSFLKANQAKLALGAFKDMMLGPEIPAGQDSNSLYRAVTHTNDELDSLGINEKELALHNPATLASLPPQFKNKFFYGSLVKKLIGEGELDSAKKVLDFTSEMGIRPDAKHMNGLIGAWFRDGSGKSASLAEHMAEKMINARLACVELREANSSLQSPVRAISTSYQMDILYTPTPPATIETFCILMHQYRLRQRNDKLVELFDTLRQARIPPNTFFMNELLRMDSRSHKRDWAWNTYLSLTKAGGVRPNYETFTVLFSLGCQSLDPVQGRRTTKGTTKFAIPQLLFAEMIKHKASLEGEGDVPQELYDAIILTFSLAEDQAGTAVALWALQRHFGAYPNDQTARTIVLQLSRLGQTNSAGYRSRRLNLRNSSTKQRIAQVTQILQQFKQDRSELLLEQGIVFEELSEEQKLGEALVVLSSLLRHAFEIKIAPENREIYTALEVSRRAADVMGVPECAPWEDNVYDVYEKSKGISHRL